MTFNSLSSSEVNPRRNLGPCHPLQRLIPLNVKLLLLQLQQSLTLQVLHNLPHAVLHTLLVTPDVDLGVLRRLIRRADAGELWDLALPRLLVQALGVARLGDFKREVDEDLDEGEWGVFAGGHGVEVARLLAVGFVGGDEGGDGDCRGVGEELCDLW